ncbi:MAG: DUF1292 domain-containing protein [Erysipelotrichales bacterium]
MLEDKITLIDDEGNEKEFEILLTFEAEDNTNNMYVFYHEMEEDIDGDEANVFVSRYDADGNIFEIESDEEFAMVEEVYNTFVDENGLGSDE